MNLSWFLPLLSLVLIAGCKLIPPYQVPSAPIPEQWKGTYGEKADPLPVAYWWEVFEDDSLNSLEALAVANNPDLYVSLEHVVAAWAQAGVKRADLFPQVNLSPSYSNTCSLFQVNLPQNIAIPGLTSIPPFRVHNLQYNLPLTMAYEVDLWGKLRSRYQSAFLDAEAQEEAYRAAMLTLTSEVAISYFQIRSLDAQIEILKRTIETRKKNTALNQSRYDKGLANFLDVTQAETDLANSSAAYEDAMRARVLEENLIATLIGLPPALFSMDFNPLKEPPPLIPAGLPTDVLLQRPDIAQAERILAANNALIGVARASFFPSLTLTGIMGYSSPDFSQFLKCISRLWSFGVDVNENVFDGGRNCSNLQLAWANFRGAGGAYIQTILTAFREVEDSLNNLEQEEKQSKQLEMAVKSSTKSTQLAMNRYYHGISPYLQVVDNERTQLQTELALANNLGVRYVSTVRLIKSLGGSWTTNCHLAEAVTLSDDVCEID